MSVSAAKNAKEVWPPVETENWPEAERRIVAELKPASLPRHVAVIMDGNGRWAKKRGLLDRVRGHEAGIESVREITRSCGTLRIEALTLYSFSKENWNRPRHEVAALMRLLEKFLVEERPELMENGVRLDTIGQTEDLPKNVRRVLAETISLTEKNRGLRLVLALSYGSRDELLRAVRRAAAMAADGKIAAESIDESLFSSLLDTSKLPDPDLMIRTSGEMRISNFLLWQIAYTELYITPVLWPDFRRPHLLDALLDYARRDRRFGRVSETDVR
ncbi:isoprenyl transferase [Candidatus Sumerlaeota bacterium]|nr:isoprenyl transferase [Candidatus Sumerlaeota bacterium]